MINHFTIELLKALINHEFSNKKIRRPQTKETEHYIKVIMKVLRTGMQWKYLNEPLNYTTYYKKLKQWSDHQIFEKAFYLLTKTKHFLDLIGNDFFIDSCIIRNKGGLKTEMIGPSYKHKFKNGTKVTIISDCYGIPISMSLSKAQVSDVKMVLPCLSKIKFNLSKIKNLGGDKGYVSKNLKNKKDINYLYYDKKNTKSNNRLTSSEKLIMKKRIAVEHTFSWIQQYRKLTDRYEKHIKSFESFIYLSLFNIVCSKIDITFFETIQVN